jgi:hypothetical protein
VLPFANMSGDPEQEYFADGMVEEIITALSRIRWLFVISRNSTFSYKGQAIDVNKSDANSACGMCSKAQSEKPVAACTAYRRAEQCASVGRPFRWSTRRRFRPPG